MSQIKKINVNGTDYNISLVDGVIDDVLMKDGESVSAAIGNKIDSSAISKVATTGSYNDLIDKPTLVTKVEFDKIMSDNADDWYGIMWTSENPSPVRVGNMNFHRNLPIQNGMKRCTLQDNGEVYGYINSADYTKYDDGRDADYSGLHGQVMVEIPEYNFDAVYYTENGVTTNLLKLYPYSKKGKVSKKLYFGAFKASSNDANSADTNKKLYSICLTNIPVENGSVNASSLTYLENAPNYRGGNVRTSSDWDSLESSQLGRPVTSMTRNDFRVRAANRGSGWTQRYWEAAASIIRLYVVEYCAFDSQATYYDTPDENGFHRGGLGGGVSTVSSWGDFNNYNPITPCGITISLGNNTGVITYQTSSFTTTVPSYRGVECPFGEIWEFTDGINIYGDSENNKSLIYTCNDITKFADNTSEGYTLRVDNAQFGTEGWIRNWNWDSNGDFIPTSQGGSSSSYLYDYCWFNNPGWKILVSGGIAYNGAGCGWFYFRAHYGSGDAWAYAGGRLCYTPQ